MSDEQILDSEAKNIDEPTSDKEKSPLDELKNELKAEKEKYVRLFAEFDNYKKRTSKERIETIKRANQELMVALLPVMDDFDRGLKELEKHENTELMEGVKLIKNKFTETLIAKGLKAMAVEQGDDFDTDKHEAITQIPAPTEDLKEKIVDVTETGYTLNGNTLRYAKVVVGQ